MRWVVFLIIHGSFQGLYSRLFVLGHGFQSLLDILFHPVTFLFEYFFGYSADQCDVVALSDARLPNLLFDFGFNPLFVKQLRVELLRRQ